MFQKPKNHSLEHSGSSLKLSVFCVPWACSPFVILSLMLCSGELGTVVSLGLSSCTSVCLQPSSVTGAIKNSSFKPVPRYDFVELEDVSETSTVIRGRWCGHKEVPPRITSRTNQIKITFKSDDYFVAKPGFKICYSLVVSRLAVLWMRDRL